tara:strand:- start:450 stop:1058 length:609 start_codon:yes stop_codon:yes gene_type:complete
MATKLTDLTELVVTPATDDFMHIVDVNDVTGGAAGTSKKITVERLFTTKSDTQTIRGFTINKSGAATNWLGYHNSFYPQMSIVFPSSGTADFDIDWTEIIPAASYNVIYIDPDMTQFHGALISTNNVTVDLSLWYVRPLCAGAAKGTLKHITTVSKTTTGGYECFTVLLGQNLLQGDIIIPLIKTSANTNVDFTGTFGIKQA